MSRELIVLCLREDKVVNVWRHHNGEVVSIAPEYVDATREFMRLCNAYEDAHISWYDERLENFITDVTTWPDLTRQPLEVLHISCFQRCDLMVGSLGLIDFDSPFLLPGPTDRRYATWLISPTAGIGLSKVFRAIGLDCSLKKFSVAMFDLGFRGARMGMCPYSEPDLLATQVPRGILDEIRKTLSATESATLIRRTYGKKWLLFWLLGNVLFENSFPLLATFRGIATKRAQPVDVPLLSSLHSELSPEVSEGACIDVIIPTLNRPEHVLNVLQDLSSQALLPKTVILVEQSPTEEPSLLEDTVRKSWPFKIQHHYVTSMGVCRARNLGLSEVQADWVLLLDDDLRLTPQFLSYLFNVAKTYRVGAVTAGIYLANQNPRESIDSPFPRVWPTFAGGASLLSREAFTAAGSFDERMEGGYGEDYEFGIRLRLNGINVLYAPKEPVLHLKAPSGGYRYTFFHPWLNDKIQPKPSPTVLYSRRKHATKSMRKGYLLFYWFKRLASKPVYRWPWEIIILTKQWCNAARWSSWLALRG